ncbi:MAG: hypothetical protein K0R25_1251 [Rickettsiaceae bacterium]|jgi:hypothetical protein|nr:hypothetical protein [Rickettsiaceae bacterium]
MKIILDNIYLGKNPNKVRFQFISSDFRKRDELEDYFANIMKNIMEIVDYKMITNNVCLDKALFLSMQLVGRRDFTDTKIALIERDDGDWLSDIEQEKMCDSMDKEILGCNFNLIGASYHAFCIGEITNSKKEKALFAIDQQAIWEDVEAGRKLQPIIQIILAKSEDELKILLTNRYCCENIKILKPQAPFRLPSCPGQIERILHRGDIGKRQDEDRNRQPATHAKNVRVNSLFGQTPKKENNNAYCAIS